ncbi:MAG: M20/M25/M40 family metallo-hydrolase [Dehalococcoidia bacterium]
MPFPNHRSLITATLAIAAFPWGVDAQEPAEYRALAREILVELVAYETTDGAEQTVPAAEAMARRLLEGGYPAEDVHVLGPRPDLGNLVVRLRGSGGGGGPILMIAHMDVVPAVADAWETDPYQLVEMDGFYYGRGSSDNKAGVATLVTNLIRWKAEGWVPNRDLIVAVTADEEVTGESMAWLVGERRDLVDAEFALNTDAGFGELRDGIPTIFSVQAAEKVYLSFRLTATNPGGHSSQPGPDNAIYDLVRALTNIAEYRFPIRLNDITKGYLLQSAVDYPAATASDMRAVAAESPDLEAAERLAAHSPHMNAILRTTCVATQLAAGHAENALPREATATVNCRIYPGVDPAEVEATLRQLIDSPEISLEGMGEPIQSPPSFLTPALQEALEDLVSEMFHPARVIPGMSTGATDGLLTRNGGIPTYGVAGIFEPSGENRAHGKDERVGVKAFHDSVEFWYRLLKRLASGE